MEEVARSALPGQALRAVIERYLSPGHANSPGSGCVRAALGPELARKPLDVRHRVEELLDGYPADTAQDLTQEFFVLCG